jgi:conjugative transfer signal peptidase TraF
MNARPAKMRKHWVLPGCLAGLVALGMWVHVGGGHRWVAINTSPSVAPGLYVRSKELPGVGSLVSFEMPSAAWSYMIERTGCDGAGWFLLKPVVAGPGDTVDTTRGNVRVNGSVVASMPRVEGRDPPVPVWRGSIVLDEDEFFVLSTRVPNSFDSRCFGPIRKSDIETVRHALVTW